METKPTLLTLGATSMGLGFIAKSLPLLAISPMIPAAFIGLGAVCGIIYLKDKTASRLLEQISAIARACGIHLILATQRPDKEVLNGRIKVNITNVLGMKTLNRTNSMVIIDHDGCEMLRVGQGIFKRGSQEVYIQVPLITEDQAEQMIKKL